VIDPTMQPAETLRPRSSRLLHGLGNAVANALSCSYLPIPFATTATRLCAGPHHDGATRPTDSERSTTLTNGVATPSSDVRR
jgi:hypothetical protein